MITYLIKLILILVFNTVVNTYYINSLCNCSCRSKQADTGSGSKTNLGTNPPKGPNSPNVKTPVKAKHKLNNDHNPLLDINQLYAPLGSKGGKTGDKKEENNTNNKINSNDNKNNQNGNNKTELKKENAPQKEVIDVNGLESVVFTLSENNGGIIKINNSDKQYSKADLGDKKIVNPLFKERVWVYEITEKLYNSINENSKIGFTYNSDNKQDKSAYIFCAVKLKDKNCFLMVCTNGNSIDIKGEGLYGLFSAANYFKKNSYYDFLSEEFKMISCGKGIYNISSMFYCNQKLKKIIFLEGFNTENVIDMNSMFAGCSSLTDLNLSKFNTGKVVNIYYMFAYCENLKKLNLSSFDKTNSLVSLGGMFYKCYPAVRLTTINKEIGAEIYKEQEKVIAKNKKK